MKPQGSPLDVYKNPLYENVTNCDGGTYPQSIQTVVRHKESGTLWACIYAIRDDDSDADMPGNWYEVEAVSVTSVSYRRKS